MQTYAQTYNQTSCLKIVSSVYWRVFISNLLYDLKNHIISLRLIIYNQKERPMTIILTKRISKDNISLY